VISSYAVLLTAGLVAQPPVDLPPVARDYQKVMTFYYDSPDPKLGPKMLKDLLSDENLGHPFFAKRPDVLTLIAAQLGDIANGKSEIVRDYEKELPGAPEAGQKVIIRALMNCGDKETLKLFDGWAKDKRLDGVAKELAALKKHLADPKRKHARDLPVKEPRDLDLLWVNFFITGEYEPVSRILDVFDQTDAKANEVLKRVAKWSLGSNLQQHPKLAEVIRKNAKDRTEGSKKVIDELINTAPQDKK
jgi:hypothetical protein